LLKDKRLEDLHKRLSFRNGQEWTKKLESLPTGIPDGGFQAASIEITPDEADGRRTSAPIVSRDAGEVVRFLIGHVPFREHLHYEPVQLWRDESKMVRVYNELYTGDWWWETQSKLPPGSTVVPILIAVDKTLMTMLHGDTVCWPVYMTIGNLDRDVRRAHDRCGIILIGFIPTIDCGKDSGREKAKFELYHESMGHILKRKYNGIGTSPVHILTRSTI
jgi:hypothetical protein